MKITSLHFSKIGFSSIEDNFNALISDDSSNLQ